MGDVAQVRVGDRERRVVDDRLMAAVADGVLTLSEYDERAAALWQAKVRSELDALVVDLPVAEVVPAEPGRPPQAWSQGVPRDRWVVAVISEDELRAPLVPGQGVAGVAVMGKAVMDLHQQALPSGTRVRATAVMGEVEVLVPPGSTVHLTGLSVMGERKVTFRPGGGPVVHVRAVAVMGSVKVREGRGEPLAVSSSHEIEQRAASAPVPHTGHPAALQPHRGPIARAGKALASSALSLALLAGAGAVIASGTDERVVFGSGQQQVTKADVDAGGTVAVSVLFGSITVVVPDDVHVDRGGLVVFGSVDCETACNDAGTKGTVELRAVGGFGSVEVLTQSEYDVDQAADRNGD